MFQRIALVLLVLAPLCHGDRYSKTNTQSGAFLPAGQVELRVLDGDVHVVPDDDSQVAIRRRFWSPRSSEARVFAGSCHRNNPTILRCFCARRNQGEAR